MRPVLAALRDPVVWVFLVAGTFEILAGDPRLHAVLLFAVGVVLLGEAASRSRSPGERARAAPTSGGRASRRPLPRPVALAGGVLFAVVVGWFRRFTWPVTAAVAPLALAAVAWAWRTPPAPAGTGAPSRWGVGLWVALFVGICLWELAAFMQQPALTTGSFAHPTVSVLLDPLFAHRPGRSAGLAVWLAIGWFLMER